MSFLRTQEVRDATAPLKLEFSLRQQTEMPERSARSRRVLPKNQPPSTLTESEVSDMRLLSSLRIDKSFYRA
ncbi:hypothetical protein Y032_0064g3498 [Ancylostoma ceylanicum]|uniref:Uncharacterized protein n=1 Tax=Ancylostoma ceylanicum TaxID=53326 RepID=A0A016U291_9BILA|nr:hypothetical protein Y032_0064g3498 [Ancylostoma ceylanicum]